MYRYTYPLKCISHKFNQIEMEEKVAKVKYKVNKDGCYNINVKLLNIANHMNLFTTGQ